MAEHVAESAGWSLDQAAAVLAMAMVVGVLGPLLTADGEPAATGRATRAAAGRDVDAEASTGHWAIGAYGGAPHTNASDVRFHRVGGATGTIDMTVHDVAWVGRPFKSPIYYGARVQHWHTPGTAAGNVGGMLDFTHSKIISVREQRVHLSGIRDGRPVPATATIGETFRHFEFSHGHNMLTLNGLYRLPALGSRLLPYVGAGAGVNLPHTEVAFATDVRRTYEYQYTGPAGQVLAGIELRLPRVTLFLEYKLTVSAYEAPLFDHDGGWVVMDLVNQLRRWRAGQQPERGRLWTTLVSHNLIAGAGARL